MSIWKTPDQKPDEADTRKQILFCAGGSTFPYLGWHYPNKGFGTWNYEDVQKWAYLEDVLAQADKAERLQKAVDLAVEVLQKAETTRELTVKGHYVNAISLDELHSALKEIKQLTQGE